MHFSGHHNRKMNKMPPKPTPLRTSSAKPLELHTTTHEISPNEQQWPFGGFESTS